MNTNQLKVFLGNMGFTTEEVKEIISEFK